MCKNWQLEKCKKSLKNGQNQDFEHHSKKATRALVLKTVDVYHKNLLWSCYLKRFHGRICKTCSFCRFLQEFISYYGAAIPQILLLCCLHSMPRCPPKKVTLSNKAPLKLVCYKELSASVRTPRLESILWGDALLSAPKILISRALATVALRRWDLRGADHAPKSGSED